MKTIIPLYKPRTVTCGEIITRFRVTHPSYSEATVSYAGRLDPMAQGLLLLLLNEENKNRQVYENLAKEYTFEMILGVTSDTYDVLGIVQKRWPPKRSRVAENLPHVIKNYIGTYQQAFPPFSSKPVNGKPLYYWARRGQIPSPSPSKTITISSLTIENIDEIETHEMVSTILKDIARVHGDFRQKEILTAWKGIIHTLPLSLPRVRLNVTCSSGTYIRSLVHDFGEKLGCGAITYSIERTRIGNFTLDKALNV